MKAPEFTDHDVERRTALIRGDGPRVTPIELDAATPALETILDRMHQVNTALDSRGKASIAKLVAEGGSPPTDAEGAAEVRTLPEIVRTMLRHADLFTCQTDLGIQLLSRGALPPRERELAVLRIGWLCQAPYEFGEHVMVAKKVGVTSEEIEWIIQGSAAPGWSEHDRAVIRATEELYADAMISDATWAVLARRYCDKQLIELPILIGQYQTVAYYQNALRLRLHEGNDGLKAR